MVEYKGYNLVSDNKYGAISIKPIGRGSVHKQLLGTFTSYSFAKMAVDRLGNSKESKSGKDANNSRV